MERILPGFGGSFSRRLIDRGTLSRPRRKFLQQVVSNSKRYRRLITSGCVLVEISVAILYLTHTAKPGDTFFFNIL